MSGFDELTTTLERAERVVWLTGAGLSVASGIAPYRKSGEAVWSRFVTDWGTRARFLADTLAWWRDFWLAAHPLRPGVAPNPGHVAVTELVRARGDDVIVTQNIDGLHARADAPRERLIEIHGRHGLYRCTDPACAVFEAPLDEIDLSGLDAGTVPTCPACGAPLRPLVLLFDELYDSHPFFRAREAFATLEAADAIVFVGTSFAVGATELALAAGARRGSAMFNVNTDSFEPSGAHRYRRLPVRDVLGRAEEILPAIADRLAGWS